MMCCEEHDAPFYHKPHLYHVVKGSLVDMLDDARLHFNDNPLLQYVNHKDQVAVLASKKNLYFLSISKSNDPGKAIVRALTVKKLGGKK